MRVIVRCPSCQQPARLPEEYAGESIECTACGRVYEPPAETDIPPAPLAELAEPEQPRPTAPPVGEPDRDLMGNLRLAALLQSLAQGLSLIVVFMLLLVVLEGPAMGTPAQAQPTRGTTATLMSLALPLTLLGYLLLSLMAAGLWALAPVRHGARGLGITLLVVTALTLLTASQLTSAVVEAGLPSRSEQGDPFRADQDRMVASMRIQAAVGPMGLYEWMRQALLAWVLFAVAAGLRRSRSLRVTALLLGIATALLPFFLLLFNLGVNLVVTDLITRGSFQIAGSALGLLLILGWSAVVALRLFTVLGRQGERQPWPA